MAGRAQSRPRTRLSPFGVALIVSALLHVSMVTLFNVVIYFPRQAIQYYQFEIREVAPASGEATPTAEEAPASGGAQLRRPSLEDALAQALGPAEPLAETALPRIQLPTLEFAELTRLRVGRAAGPDYEALLGSNADDSWARFSGGLKRLGQSLTSLALPGEEGLAGLAPTEGAPRPTLRPAEGFEGTIEWSAPPLDRELLYAPPIKALWEASPSVFPGSIEVVIEVNALGRVVSVFSPDVDAAGVTDAVQVAMLKYRFAPVEGEGAPPRQMGTVRIRRAGAAP